MSSTSLAGKRVAMISAAGMTDLRLMSALKQEGARVVAVGTLRSASPSAMLHANPDVVILSVNRLPVAKAAEACREIASKSNAKVVALTHIVDDDARQQLREAGATDVLGIPIRAERIVQQLQHILHAHSV